jgi:hypothetical protein
MFDDDIRQALGGAFVAVGLGGMVGIDAYKPRQQDLRNAQLGNMSVQEDMLRAQQQQQANASDQFLRGALLQQYSWLEKRKSMEAPSARDRFFQETAPPPLARKCRPIRNWLHRLWKRYADWRDRRFYDFDRAFRPLAKRSEELHPWLA